MAAVRKAGLLAATFTLVALAGPRQPGAPSPTSSPPSSAARAYSAIPNAGPLDRWYREWVARHEAQGGDRHLVMSLRHSKAFSDEPCDARGRVILDLVGGWVEAEVRGLDDPQIDGLWLVDNLPGEGRSAQPERGDRFLLAGRLEAAGAPGEFRHSGAIDPEELADFEVDAVVLARRGVRPEGRGVLFGAPRLFQRLYTRERLGVAPNQEPSARDAVWPGIALAQQEFPTFDALVIQGADLFFDETFDGNGRTCGTCHPAENNFTLDADFIAGLPSTDELFLSNLPPALAQNFEIPSLLPFGLILENVDGFTDLPNRYTLRSVPHTLGLFGSTIAPLGFPPGIDAATGWSGDGAPGSGTLREFANGAIRQHFPLSLNRTTGVDFRFATDGELDALEAFQLFIGRDEDPSIESMVFLDALVANGRNLFVAFDSVNGSPTGKCAHCHHNGGAVNVTIAQGTPQNLNFGTGVEANGGPAATIAPLQNRPDGGFGLVPAVLPQGPFGDGQFNIPPVVEAADTPPFFHNNSAATIESAVIFYISPTFQASSAAQAIAALDGGVGINLTTNQADDIAKFLRVLNALENIRSAREFAEFARQNVTNPARPDLLILADRELADAFQVLDGAAQLHPDARASIADARSLVQSATFQPISGLAAAALDQALCRLDEAAADMVEIPGFDCNGNGISDACDPDCDEDGAPNDCEFAAGTAEDCTGNGIPDNCDIAAGLFADCNGNDVPDFCELITGPATDCNANGIPDDCDVAAGLLAECNGNGIADLCELMAGTATDCNMNAQIDECDVTAGVLADCDDDGTADLCEIQATPASLDCNGNLQLDSCEIGDGAVTDCNGNGKPDSCDLVSGVLPDCNGNQVADLCEIQGGLATDCNLNGILDSCDLGAGTLPDCNVNGIADVCEIISGTQEDCNLDGILDVCQGVTCAPEFIRGDADASGVPGLADAIGVLFFLFAQGATPVCPDAADVNDDGALSLADAIHLLFSLFAGGAPPAPPFPVCGQDPTTGDTLDCLVPPNCP